MSCRNRHLPIPNSHFFLFGPRGTGKSTFLRSAFPDGVRIDLLRPDVRLRLEARPEQLRHDLLAMAPGATVVLDEVQRLPELLDTVHELIEARHVGRFALTGSSARKLRLGGVNLLAGRAAVSHLHPYMASELGPDFSLERALRVGMIPLVVEAEDSYGTLVAYLGTYLEQEVRAEGLVRNAGVFSRVLRAAAFSHGQVLNASNVAHECAVDRRTVSAYFEILRDLMLVFDVEPFDHRSRRDGVSRPRQYWFDPGVWRLARQSGPGDADSETDGLALEGLMAQHLRAWADYTGLVDGRRHRLQYWRTRGGLEVDFILAGPMGFWAIEVKNSTRLAPQDLRGLRTFAEEYPEAKPLVLYRGAADRIGAVPCLPVDDFLRVLRPGQPLNLGLDGLP